MGNQSRIQQLLAVPTLVAKRMVQTAAALLIGTSIALAAGGGEPTACTPKDVPHNDRHWGFQGVFGKYDTKAAFRGFEVFRGTCAACHSLKYFTFRNLADLDVPEDAIKGIAAEYEVMAEPNDDGEVLPRTAIPSDYFPSPFANEKAAASVNGGAVPPDLSLMVKARASFENHVPNILSGYIEAPEGCEVPEGKYYNAYYPGHIISMAPPLADDAIEYKDGTKATKEQMIKDVSEFLAYVAEPKLNERKSMGFKILIFLLILTVLLYLTKKQIWRNLH